MRAPKQLDDLRRADADTREPSRNHRIVVLIGHGGDPADGGSRHHDGDDGREPNCPLQPALAPGASQQAPANAARPRSDATRAQTPTPAATQSSSSRALRDSEQATDRNTAGDAIPGGVPDMGGVTPNRAELPGSAFTKLDGAGRGYLLPEDVRQLQGFDSAFREADQNGDGRLNASEFNKAWGIYTGNVR